MDNQEEEKKEKQLDIVKAILTIMVSTPVYFVLTFALASLAGQINYEKLVPITLIVMLLSFIMLVIIALNNFSHKIRLYLINLFLAFAVIFVVCLFFK